MRLTKVNIPVKRDITIFSQKVSGKLSKGKIIKTINIK